VICVSGLSKAYGIPGVRIGWLVASPAIASEVWRLHDYTTIGPSKLSDAIACFAVRPDIRDRLLARGVAIAREQFPLVEELARESRGVLQFTLPRSTSMAFMGYSGAEGSAALCTRLLEKHSVLAVDGGMLGCDGYVRIWAGAPRDRLVEGLERIRTALREA
jgi:aspartate/methionine/tyrosine aminotransferase